MNICVVGSGYVGLVTAACLADSGQTVVSADVDAAKIRSLEAGEVPIFEPGLAEMIRRNTAEKRLTFTNDVESALAKARSTPWPRPSAAPRPVKSCSCSRAPCPSAPICGCGSW